jgi:hypothetical protein
MCVYLPRSSLQGPDEFAARLNSIDALEQGRALETSVKEPGDSGPESPGSHGAHKGLH